MTVKELNYFMNLPYTIKIRFIDDEADKYYHAKCLELGVQAHGDTPEEAFHSLREAMKLVLEVKLEYEDPIPEP